MCHADLLAQIARRASCRSPISSLRRRRNRCGVQATPAPTAGRRTTRRDGDDWVEAQPALAGRGQARRPMIYTSGTTGCPRACAQASKPAQLATMARVSGIAYGVKTDRHQVILMNGPMYHSATYSYGCWPSVIGCNIVLQAAVRSRGHAASDRTASRHPHAHGADHVRATAAAAGRRSRRRYDLVVAALRRARRGALPARRQAAMIEWWGPIINEYYRLRPKPASRCGIPRRRPCASPAPSAGRSRAASCKIFDADGRSFPARRGRRDVHAPDRAPGLHYHGNAAARAEAGRDGLVNRRRRRLSRRGRLSVPVRSQARHGDLGRRQHLSRGDRGRADRHGGRARLRGVRHSRRRVR